MPDGTAIGGEMARKWWWIAMVLLLAACQREAPEERLRKQFAGMQAATEQGKPGDFMEGVSQDFAGDGGMDHAALYRLREAAWWWMLEYNEQRPHDSLGDLTPVEYRQQVAGRMRHMRLH